MNKLKHLIIVALIAMLSCGVAVGCTTDSGIPADQPHKVVFCANGGEMGGKAERYFNFADKAPINPIAEPTRKHYVFKGWALGSLDADGNPVYASSAKYLDDGGVWYDTYGEPNKLASRDKEKHGSKKSYETSDVHHFYDYDATTVWDFQKGKLTESVVLVAMWEKEHEYIITIDVNETYENIKSDFQIKGFDINLASYESEFSQPISGNTAKKSELVSSFDDNAENKYFTAYEFFTSPLKTQESKVGDNYKFTQPFTVFYANYIDGTANQRKFAYVTDFKGFESAVKANKDIYVAQDIVLDERNTYTISEVSYSGTIEGAGHTISGIKVTVSQIQRYNESESNIYGVLFGELNGAQIRDISFDVVVDFEIGVDPDGWSDAYKRQNPLLTAELYKSYNQTCRIGLLAAKITKSVLYNVSVSGKYNITRTYETNREKLDDGVFVNVTRYNDYIVNAVLIGMQAYSDSDSDAHLGNTVVSCSTDTVRFGEEAKAGAIVG